MYGATSIIWTSIVQKPQIIPTIRLGPCINAHIDQQPWLYKLRLFKNLKLFQCLALVPAQMHIFNKQVQILEHSIVQMFFPSLSYLV